MRATAQRLLPAVATSLMLAMAVAGCSPSNPTPTPTRTASVPVFTSDAQALTAATEAYAAYLKMSDTITREGGLDPERIRPFVTPGHLKSELTGFKAFSDRQIRTVGQSTFDQVRLQSFAERSGVANVNIYLCFDTSAIRVIDKSDQDVTPTGQVARQPLIVGLTGQAPSLVVSKSAVWSGASFC